MKRLLLALVPLLVLWPTIAAAEHALGVRWPRHEATRLTLRSEMSPEWDAVIAAEMAAWNLSSVIEMSRQAGACDGSEHICIRPYSQAQGSYVAFTTWGKHGKNFTHVSIAINVYFLTVPNYSVTCHELGHALGLAHAEYGEPSCMTPGPTSMWPSAHDLAQLEAIY